MPNSNLYRLCTFKGHDVYEIVQPHFTARISVHGGQLLSFMNHNEDGCNDWFWLSDSAITDGTKPIRGGVPLCWPWFGPSGIKGQPQHGYARVVPWQVDDIQIIESNTAQNTRQLSNDTNSIRSSENALALLKALKITLSPKFDKQRLAHNLGVLEQHLDSRIDDLNLQVHYTFSDSVTIQLTSSNTSTKTIDITEAIHSYFKIDDIDHIEIKALRNIPYYDQLLQELRTQQDSLEIKGPIDAIYHAPNEAIILDEKYKMDERQVIKPLSISGLGHNSVVVWNPWKDGAEKMQDFDNNGYITMLCVEMANTERVSIKPGASHTLTQIIKRHK